MGGSAIGPLFGCLMTFPVRGIPPGYTLMTNASRGSRQQGNGGQGAPGRRNGADACEVLDERLAHGEIDDAGYQRLRSLIAAGEDQAPAGSSGTRRPDRSACCGAGP